jgi:hypothetical protein
MASQPVPGFLILAYYNDSPFSLKHVNEPGDETLFREFIHKPANSSLNGIKVIFGDLILRITFTYSGHPDVLLSDCGITKLPSSSGSLSLPNPRSAPGQPLVFTWTL